LRRRWIVPLFGLLLLGSASLAGPFYPNLSPQIHAFLGGHKSPIVNDPSSDPAFILAGVMNNVDPRLIAALTGPETTYGTNYGRCPAAGFNAWSWLPRNTCKSFKSYGDAINYSASALNRLYLDVGLTTIPAIFNTYCKTGCASDWVSVVTAAYTKMGGNATDLFYLTLDGTWEGTATFTNPLDGTNETIPISASFTVMSNSIAGNVMVTEPGDVLDINAFAYNVTGLNTFSLLSSNDLTATTINATGNANINNPSPGQAVITGLGTQGTNPVSEQATGTVTFTPTEAFLPAGPSAEGAPLTMSGNVMITDLGDGTRTNGSGMLTITPDGTMSGSARSNAGDLITWSAQLQ
jgi:hypothetical protein